MTRQACLAVVSGLVLATAAPAQPAAWRFHWQPGQVLVYQVEQATSATEVVEGKQSQTTSRLANTKRWQVLDVDATGVATLQLSLTALRLETTTPAGETLKFDSADPKGGDPQLREQLARFVGPPLMVLRVGPQGNVVEVKECKFGAPSRLESEPPFALTLPAATADAGRWERAYQVTLEPPHGTGQKFAAVQRYAVQSTAVKPAGNVPVATVTLATELKAQPEAVGDHAPLLQMLPEGEVVFNTQTGIMESARLRVDKELKDHQGEGSSYRFQSTYTERYVGAGTR
jgi:hypothetical protein